MSVEAPSITNESMSKVMDFCRYLRADMGGMFVNDITKFLDVLPTQLVDEAEKASLSDQQDYFDIITLLKRDSEQIHLSMNTSLTIALEEFVHHAQQVDKKEATTESSDNLSLIDTDDIEVSIVVEGLAGRIASQLSETIEDTFLRLKQLVPTLHQSTQLPCHPRALIQAMLDSMATLSLNTSQRIILAKLFTPLVDGANLKDIIERSLESAKIPTYDRTIRNLDYTQSSMPATSEDVPSAAEKAEHPGQYPAQQHPQNGQQFSQTQPHQVLHGQPNNQAFSPAGHAHPNQSIQVAASLLNNTPAGTSTADMAAQLDARYAEMENSALSAEQASHNQPQASSGSVQATHDTSQLLQQLGHLKALRKQMAQMPVTPEPKNPMVVEQALATPALDGLLSDIQQEQPTTSIREDDKIQSIGEIRNTIRSRLKSDDETVQTIQDKDSDVINLVSLMFDYILDNPNLPTAMKALLARLQIPMLRVALLTPSFFAESNHPARQLLDNLSKAGISWDKAADRDKYYDKLESIVFRVLKEFRNDISIFETLRDDLAEFLTTQKKQAERIDSRTKNTEEKRAQTEVSKNFVQKQLNERLIGKKLPFPVVKILQNGWWHVLFHTLIRHGKESTQWKNALKVVDALVWSVQPPVADREQWLEQVGKIRQKLIDNLTKGLSQVNFDPLQKTQLIHEINTIHQDVLAEKNIDHLTVDVERSKAPNSINDVVSQDAELLNSKQSTDRIKSAGDKIETPEIITKTDTENDNASHNNSTATSGMLTGNIIGSGITGSVDTSEASHTAISLPSDLPSTLAADSDVKTIDPSFIAQAKQITSGTWVEFKADTDEPLRCKLVAKIRALDKLVFTNRRGIKVAEIGQSKLARQLSEGKARIIVEDDHIVETALNAVMNDLDKLESNDDSDE